MDIGSIFLLLALAILVGMFLLRPFLERASATVSSAERELSTLLAQRDRVLAALQELDFDHALGKIPEEEYPTQRLRMLNYGAEILRKLDAFQGQPAAEKSEDRLEAAIAARRAAGNARPGLGSAQAPDDQIEAMIAARRRVRQEKAMGFCAKCGGALQKSDRFCPRCGAGVT